MKRKLVLLCSAGLALIAVSAFLFSNARTEAAVSETVMNIPEPVDYDRGFEVQILVNGRPLDEYAAPRSVPSQASFVMAGRKPLVSVSGGVQIFPWQVADHTEVAKDLASTRQPHPAAKSWYWQR